MPLIVAIVLSFLGVKDPSVAAEHVIPVRLNGDAERKLVKRYKVSAYPALLPLDGQGPGLDRAVGHRRVAETAKFLKTPR